MPLSKARMRERKRQDRAGLTTSNVKPKTKRINGKDYIVPDLDADGNPIPRCDSV